MPRNYQLPEDPPPELLPPPDMNGLLSLLNIGFSGQGTVLAVLAIAAGIPPVIGR